MKITVLDEPELEFAYGSRHIDPRFGIEHYGPADVLGTGVRSIVPARVVIHKTSSYTEEERRGFWTAAGRAGLSCLELLWLLSRDAIRLFRSAYHPPLRGTFLSLDDTRHSLYTRGSVPFYSCYPGMYIPQPLAMRLIDVESSPKQLAEEILVLSKMNWNQTQLDGRQPITLRTADRVGEILRHVEDGAPVAPRYSSYM